MILFLLALNPIVHAGKETLSTGVAKVDITPAESLYMGGYSTNMRDAPSDGTYGKIFIRSIVFDDSANKVVFIVSDLVGYEDYDGLREKVAAETGIPLAHILLASTHNHAGPTIGGRNAASTWSSQFTDKVVESVRNAIKDLEPVTIGGGTGGHCLILDV
jgi:predicted neutral ceramidase superfamily lipid hydrolase